MIITARGEIERNGNLIYVNAGHPPPLLVNGNTISELQATGMVIGALPEIALNRANWEDDATVVVVKRIGF